MEHPLDIKLSRRELLLAGAASATATGLPAVAAAQEAGPPGATPSSTAAPVNAKVSLTVNGRRADLALDTRTTLLDALREHLRLTGTKKGCDHGQCGACLLYTSPSPRDS